MYCEVQNESNKINGHHFIIGALIEILTVKGSGTGEGVLKMCSIVVLSCSLYVPYRVDIALVSGDLADMPLELCHSAPPEETRDQHMLLDKVLEEFSPLASKVYYVPGNVSWEH